MNIDHYKTAKAEIQSWYLRQDNKDPVWCVSLISASSHVPAIVCAFWIGEVSGWPESILKNIENLYLGYSYKNIEGIPDSYPGVRK